MVYAQRQKAEFAFKNLRRLRTPFRVAKKVGEGLGPSALLQ